MTSEEKIRVIRAISQAMDNPFQIHFGKVGAHGRVMWDDPAPLQVFGAATMIGDLGLSLSCESENEVIALQSTFSRLSLLAVQVFNE
jgi:hypothetical protein